MIEGLILIGFFILYVISLYKLILSILDWDTLTDARRTREGLIYFLIYALLFILSNILICCWR